MIFRSVSLCFALGLFWGFNAHAENDRERSDDATEPDASIYRQVWEQPFLVANEFFGTTLPGTLEEYNLSLTFRPRAGDFVQRDFIRFPVGLRYGFTENFEGQLGISPFSPNPFRGLQDHRWGMGEYQLGLRYAFTQWRPIWAQAMIGLDFRSPLGRPPVDLIDGYAHVRPFLTMTRPIAADGHLIFYLTLVHDESVDAPFRRSDAPDEVIRQHISDVTPGFLYKPDELGYFIDYTTRWINEPTQTRHAHEYRAGVIWDPPRAQTRRLRLPRGDWQFELGYALRDEQERSLRHSIQFRARWEGNLKEFLRWGNNVMRNGNGSPDP